MLKVLLLLTLMFSFTLKSEELTDFQKQMLYNNMKKNRDIATLLSAVIPSAGHAYAGNWTRGIIIGGAGLAVFGGVMSATVDRLNMLAPLVAFVPYSIIKIYEIYDSREIVREHNQKIYDRVYNNKPKISFGIAPYKKGARAGLLITF